MRKTHCQIHLRVRSETRRGRHSEAMYVEVKGIRKSVESALCTLEESLLGLVHYYEKSRALYYMALKNNHRFMIERNGCEIVYQYCYHHNKKGMQYIFYNRFPEGFRDALGLLIGVNGSRMKKLMNQAKCLIEVNPESYSPHYVIFGNAVDAVDRCAQRLEASLMEAMEFKKNEKRRRQEI